MRTTPAIIAIIIMAFSAGLRAQSLHQQLVQEVASQPASISEDTREMLDLQQQGKLFPKAASQSLQEAPATGIGSDFIVFGYEQAEDQIYHTRWQALTHIASQFVSFDSSGNIVSATPWTGRDPYLKAGGAAQAAGTKVILTMLNQGFSQSVIDSVLQSQTNRENLANNVKNLMTADGYCGGVTFDFEPFTWGTATRDGMTAFFVYLRSILPSNYEISVYGDAIFSSTEWDIPNLQPNLNYILYSAYDWGTGSTPHAITDHNNCLPNIKAYLDAGLPPSKMVVTISAYGGKWSGVSTYNGSGGSARTSRGFTDGLYDITLQPTYGGPYTKHYVTGDEVSWYTWNDGSTTWVATMDDPEAMEYKIRHVLSFQDSTGTWSGRRLGGVGFWSLYWMAELSSYNINPSDGAVGTVARTRTYPHVYQLCQEILHSPGQKRFVFEGFEGLDYRWRDPNASPDTTGDTNSDSARSIVAKPSGAGAPSNSTNAMQVIFDFEGTGSNKAFFRYEVLNDNNDTGVVDTNATSAHFDVNTLLTAYLYTPASYANYTIRMVVMDKNRQLERSNAFPLNASGWRSIQWNLTDASKISGYTTSEPSFVSGNGVLDTAGDGAKDISFIGFLIEGTGVTNSASVVLDELSYEHANPSAKNYTINEFRFSDPASEFVEIYGPAGAFPPGFQLRMYDNTGLSPVTVPLAGLTVPNDGGGYGYFVVGDPSVPNVDYSTGFSNSTQDLKVTDASALQLYSTATGCVYDSVVYRARGGLGDLIRQQTHGVTGEGYAWCGGQGIGTNASGAEYTLGRYPDGGDTDVNENDISFMPATPGASNCVTVPLGTSYDFTSAPPNAYQTFGAFSVANPVSAGLPASPSGGNAHRCADVNGGVISLIGDAKLGSDGNGYSVQGEIYIPASTAGAQAIGIGLCGHQGTSFFTNSTYVADTGYESGYWLIYENKAGVGLNDGLADHGGTFQFVWATNDNMHNSMTTLLGSNTRVATGAPDGGWAKFRLSIDPHGVAYPQLVIQINNVDIYRGALPSGGPTSGAIQFGFRENHSGNTLASEGTWVDNLRIDAPCPTSLSRYELE